MTLMQQLIEEMAQQARDHLGAVRENERLSEALDRIAFCGAGEDYRVLREIARKALANDPSPKTLETSK